MAVTIVIVKGDCLAAQKFAESETMVVSALDLSHSITPNSHITHRNAL